eukprot:3805369-Amphidinium_carterae.1
MQRRKDDKGSHRTREVTEAPAHTIIHHHGNVKVDKYFAGGNTTSDTQQRRRDGKGHIRFRRYNETTTIYSLTTMMMTYLSTITVYH